MISDLHVVCSYVGSMSAPREPAAVMGRPLWSERVSFGETTEKAAPGSGENGNAIFYLVARVGGYAKIGPDPDAPDCPEIYIKEEDPLAFYVNPLDRIKWVEG